MKLYTNRRNPVLPPDWHMPDSEATCDAGRKALSLRKF